MKSEIEQNADFTEIRYAQCWEDADILLEALDVKEGGHYVSIGSAGDNSFAILSKNPGKVTVLDMNESQLFCVELRKEAYRRLDYEEFLHLAGVKSQCSKSRETLYQSIREGLTKPCQRFWDSHPDKIQAGYIHAGKFEHYVIYGNYDRNVLPYALREENFAAIKKNIDHLEIKKECMEGYLVSLAENKIDGFNLSDIFEYMSQENMEYLYQKIVRAAKPGARVAYWNMLVPRSCPKSLHDKVKLKKTLSKELTRKDKAYFYSRFLVEEVR